MEAISENRKRSYGVLFTKSVKINLRIMGWNIMNFVSKGRKSKSGTHGIIACSYHKRYTDFKKGKIPTKNNYKYGHIIDILKSLIQSNS